MPAVQPNSRALIFNIMRFATHDGPGIRTAVFFQGCPLSCWWCHNPEGQSFLPDRLYFADRCRHCLDCLAACPRHAISATNGTISTSAACDLCGQCVQVCMAEARQIAGIRHSVAELMAEVEKDGIFFDDSAGGITLSGGEPLSQPVFAAAFLRACRQRGVATAIETCGFAPAKTFLATALAADRILFDLKLADREKHRRYTGVSNELILQNLKSAIANHPAVTVRIPVVPGVNDGEGDIAEFGACLRDVRARRVELLPYHQTGADKYRRLGREYKLADTPEPGAADLARFRDTLARADIEVTVGG